MNSGITKGNGISMEDLRRVCLRYSIEALEIGESLKAIAEHLDYSGVSGDGYIITMLSERAMELANEVDNMPFELKAKEICHE